MATTDGPVCLTRSAPDDAYAGHILFYDVIPPSVLSRSPVLSSIADAGDTTSFTLPDFVTLADFKAWRSAVTAAEVASDCKDIVHACRVLKAADALSDHCCHEWLAATAKLLHEQAVTHPRSQAQAVGPAPDVSAGLSNLPEHLNRRIFDSVTHGGSESLGVLLDVLPSSLGATLLEATILHDQTLTAVQHMHSLPFFNALEQLPASPPSLLSLALNRDIPPFVSPTLMPRGTPVQERAAAFADALRHHYSLTSLRLDTFCDSDSMLALAPAIGTLTGLEALHVGTDYHDHIPHNALPHVAVALQPLSSLRELRIWIGVSPTQEYSRKRARGDGSESDDAPLEVPVTQSQHCLASLLSAVSSLTSLDISESWGQRRLLATLPLSLPLLKHLKVTSGKCNTASVLLSQLTAPLATLIVHDRGEGCWSLDDIPLAHCLWRSLQKFVQLKSLDIGLRFTPSSTALEHALLAGAPAAMASLSSLQELKVDAENDVLQHVIQGLAASESGVRRIMFSGSCARHQDPAAATETWRALLASLSRLKLVYLHVNLRGHLGPGPSGGIAALSSLTQLTALQMHGWTGCLATAEDCEALAGMHQLESLCICAFSAPADAHAACVRCFAALPRLTELAFEPNDRADGFHTAFVQHAPGLAWPALQWFSLYPVSEEEAVAIARAVAGFPALQELMLCDDADDPFLYHEYYGAGTSHCPLHHVASEVKFSVDVGWDLDSEWSRFDWQSELM